MEKTAPENLLIGAHTSIAGGVHNALLEGHKIGATTIQLFTANQRRWESKPISQESVDLWKKTREELNIRKVMSHDSYLVNLGASDEEMLAKSRKCFREEALRCLSLEIDFLNFHPGAALTDDPQRCLDRICESLLLLRDLLNKDKLQFLLETTAGQGSAVGYRFEHLAYIIQKVGTHIPLGVCIDTCHIFVAGYDIASSQACEATLQEFDRVIGLKHLYAFHFNDSSKGLGSRVDRHQDLGQGKIGWDCFKFFMQDPRTREIPKYLETPGGDTVWEQEIRKLREFAT